MRVAGSVLAVFVLYQFAAASSPFDLASAGDVTWTAATGPRNMNSVQYPGTVSSGDSASPAFNNFNWNSSLSVALWVLPSAYNCEARFISQGWFLSTDAASQSFHGFVPAGTCTTASAQCVVSAGFANNRWTHVAMVYNGTGLALFVSGVLVNSIAVSGPINPTAVPLELTSCHLTSTTLADVRIYTRVLDAAEISILSQPSVRIPASVNEGMFVYYDFPSQANLGANDVSQLCLTDITLTTVTPNVISLSESVTVTITGANLDTANLKAVFNGIAVTTAPISSTQVSAVVPSPLACGVASLSLVAGTCTSDISLKLAVRANVINTVTPTSFPASGGSLLTITGPCFSLLPSETASCSFESTSQPVIVGATLIDANTITCAVPALSAGAYSLSVTLGTSKASFAPNLYTYDQPIISGVFPDTILDGGATVTIHGQSLVPVTGGPQALCIFNNDNSTAAIASGVSDVVCVTPTLVNPGPLSVSVRVGILTSSPETIVVTTGPANPAMTHVSGSGLCITAPCLVCNPSVIQIQGNDQFGYATSLDCSTVTASFDGPANVSFSILSHKTGQCSLTYTACTQGKYALQIRLQGQLIQEQPFVLVVGSQFQYGTPNPNGITVGDSARVIVAGSFFSDCGISPYCTFAKDQVKATVLTSTAIACYSPSDLTVGAYPLSVSVAGAPSQFLTNFRVFVMPTLATVTPTSGLYNGEVQVTVTGTGFLGAGLNAPSCMFGGVSSTGVIRDDTSLVCNVPTVRTAGLVSVSLEFGATTVQSAGVTYTYLSSCQSDCSGHGICLDSGHCLCNMGFSGDGCESPIFFIVVGLASVFGAITIVMIVVLAWRKCHGEYSGYQLEA